MKDRENYDLLKVPDEIIIRELRIELDKANSRVQELEDELKAHSNGKIQELIKSLKGTIKALVKEKKSDKYYQLYQEQRKRNDRLTQSNSALIGKILILQTKVFEDNATLLEIKQWAKEAMNVKKVEVEDISLGCLDFSDVDA